MMTVFHMLLCHAGCSTLVLGLLQCYACLLPAHDSNAPHAAWRQVMLRSCGITATCLICRLQQKP